MPKAWVEVKNFGQTPAYDFRMSINIRVEKYQARLALPKPRNTFGRSDIAPGAYFKINVTNEPPVADALVSLIGTAAATVFVYGRIEYRDAFDKEHWTNFRLIHGGAQSVKVPDQQLAPDAEGNDTN